MIATPCNNVMGFHLEDIFFKLCSFIMKQDYWFPGSDWERCQKLSSRYRQAFHKHTQAPQQKRIYLFSQNYYILIILELG